MSLVLFEGAAGTGKTTQLFASARLHLQDYALTDGQKVLALTKYHGSRKRLTARLTGPDGIGAPVSCMTIDSFASMLVHRWRGLVQHFGLAPKQVDFQATTSAAACLLREGAGSWIASSFPLVLVDEMQDCQGAEIELLAGLEPHVHCIAGADTFQDLTGNLENEAITWACGVSTPTPLTKVYRTRQSGLLNAALALRVGEGLCLDRAPGFDIMSAPAASMAGANINWKIKSWGRYGQIAVISPTTRQRSPFVVNVTRWVGENAAKTSRGTETAGPYRLDWESGDEEAAEAYEAALDLDNRGGGPVSCIELQSIAIDAGIRELEEWSRRQRFLKGRETVAAEEIRYEIHQIVRRRRVFADSRSDRRFALTVHQAKNREFESVIVLWPLQIRSDPEQQRRLLYNAITRAKLNALVIVEDPKRNRLGAPPFT